MWELDYKEGWAPKSDVFELWCWRRLLRVLWNTTTVNLKGNQSWIFIGRTDAEADAPIIWPPDTKSQLTRKDPNAGKDWRWEEKGTTEDEMVKWHHWLNGDEFEQTPGDGEGQGSLMCCSPRGHKELDTAERLSNNKYLQSKFSEEDFVYSYSLIKLCKLLKFVIYFHIYKN